MSGRVSLSGTLHCSAEDVARVRAAIPEHVRLTRAEPGCLTFRIDETPDAGVFEVYELFRDAAAFEAHQARTRTSEWWRIAGQMQRSFAVATE